MGPKLLVAAVCLIACAGSASAQNLKLEFTDGRVSIDAAGVPVRTVLAEWARLGGTKVVGSEKLSGAPLTIQLDKVPEAQALSIILRNVAGYMAAPRRADATGASAYDRILVLPTSTAPAASASAGARGTGPNAVQRGTRAPFGVPQAPEPDAVVAQEDPADTGVNEPPFQFPQQNPFQNAVGQPGPFGTPMPPNGQTPVFQFGGAPAQGGVSVNPTPEQAMPTLQFPGMPPAGSPVNPGGFGIGSPTPGVVLQPAQPGQPGRPPGGP